MSRVAGITLIAMTRRTLVSSLAFAATIKPQTSPNSGRRTRTEWMPRLGVLGRYTPANVEFARAHGFTNMILSAGPRSTLDVSTLSDAQVQEFKTVLQKNDMHVSAFQIDGNHTAPDSRAPESGQRLLCESH
jgi:hypothetical protein